MSKGWISLYRQIQDHWLWQNKPFSKAQAFIDLLLSANHTENKLYVRGVLIIVGRGQLFTSELKLAERWGWDRKTVRRFLELLKKDEMITTKGTVLGTTITLINYDKFQTQGATGCTAKLTTDDTAESTRTIMSNNGKSSNKHIKNRFHNFNQRDDAEYLKHELDAFDKMFQNDG